MFTPAQAQLLLLIGNALKTPGIKHTWTGIMGDRFNHYWPWLYFQRFAVEDPVTKDLRLTEAGEAAYRLLSAENLSEQAAAEMTRLIRINQAKAAIEQAADQLQKLLLELMIEDHARGVDFTEFDLADHYWRETGISRAAIHAAIFTIPEHSLEALRNGNI